MSEWPSSSRRPIIESTMTRYGPMTYDVNDEYLGRALAEYGEYCEREVDLFRSIVRDGDTVIDIGANIGCVTVPLARIVGPVGRVFAFEPVPCNLELLRKNVKGLPVTVCACALGAVGGEIGVPVWDQTVPHNSGGHSLIKAGAAAKAKVKRLDDLKTVKRCSFIKIDVEGMERDVLLGGRDFIQKHKPLLYVENDRVERSDALISLLSEMDYFCWWHIAPLYNPNNYDRNETDIYGDTHSFNMLCHPVGHPWPGAPGIRPARVGEHPLSHGGRLCNPHRFCSARPSAPNLRECD